MDAHRLHGGSRNHRIQMRPQALIEVDALDYLLRPFLAHDLARDIYEQFEMVRVSILWTCQLSASVRRFSSVV